MSAIWIQNRPLLDQANAGYGRGFSEYLPIYHPAPTPYHTRGYVQSHTGAYPADVAAFSKSWPQQWIRPWFNDPTRMIWDEENQLWRGFTISAINPETDGDTTAQTWMEIVSPDMLTFINNRIPFFTKDLPYPQLWGGSFLLDKEGAAGFGKEAVLYFISLPGSDKNPQQCVGLWVAPKLGLAPVYYGVVLENPGAGDIVHAPGMDFRDPRVDWDVANKQFVMKLTIGRGIAFYGSRDGQSWAFLSQVDLSAWQQIETPDLVPMEAPDGTEKWMLAFSLKQWNGQTASSIGYLIGGWDGRTFTPDFTTPKRLNWGSDYYAQAISQHGGKTYCWGWMGNWNYMDLPTQGFGGNHSLMTELHLAVDPDGSLGLRMNFLPDQPNCYASFTDDFISTVLSGSGQSQWIPPITNPGVSWRLDLQLYRASPAAWSDEIVLTFCAGNNNSTTLTLFPKSGTCSLSRANSGKNPLDAASSTAQSLWKADQTAPLPSHARYDISLIVDVSTIEVIINDEVYLSSLFFPPDDAFSINLNAQGAGQSLLVYYKMSY